MATGVTPQDIESTVWDALIVGSGPLGCTFARRLIEEGGYTKVLMIDAGAKLSERPGWHLKNSYLYQRNVNEFTGVISGHLHTLSIPPDKNDVPTLDPGAFKVDYTKYPGFVGNNANPEQSPYENLPSAAATYAVGGMATHWTACTPEEHPEIERSKLITAKEWKHLYKEAKKYLKTSQDMFDDTKPGSYAGQKGMPTAFFRNTIVLKTLKDTYPNLKDDSSPQYLPLAGERRSDMPQFITWSGSDTVLGDKIISELGTKTSKLVLKEMWQCVKLIGSDKDGESDAFTIQKAKVKELLTGVTHIIQAKKFIICAGAVLTPQILFNSGIQPKALGHYLCEQPLAFCQVVLLQSLVDQIITDPKWSSVVTTYKNEKDPIPIPPDDPQPQCWIPVSEGRPWHCQIHRDAFSYGGIAPNVDTRLIVDLRWFGKVTPRFENCVTFSKHAGNKDSFGMPQPTFEFSMTKEEGDEAHKMMEDMLKAAGKLGGFLPGSEPAFQPPGLALHITGTCRMGEQDDGTCVVDTNSKVWKYDNLYLGTCGVIERGTACNPTLTAMAIAIKSCNSILGIRFIE